MRQFPWRSLAVGVAIVVLSAAWSGRSRGLREAKPVAILSGHRFPVQSLAFSPDGETLTATAFFHRSAVGSVEATDWDVRTLQPKARRTPLSGVRRCISVACCARTLATATDDRNVWLLAADSAVARQLSSHRSQVYALAFSGDGARLVTADFDDQVIVWDVATGRREAACRGHAGLVLALAVAPNGRTLAIGGDDHAVRVWDADTGDERWVLRGHMHDVRATAYARDGRTLASGDATGVVKLWDLTTGIERASLGNPVEDTPGVNSINEVTAIEFAHDGRTLAVAINRVVTVWETSTGRRIAQFVGHEGRVTSLAFSPNGRLLSSGGWDRTLRLWDLVDRQPIGRRIGRFFEEL